MGIKISNIASSGGFKLSGNNVGRFIVTTPAWTLNFTGLDCNNLSCNSNTQTVPENVTLYFLMTLDVGTSKPDWDIFKNGESIFNSIDDGPLDTTLSFNANDSISMRIVSLIATGTITIRQDNSSGRLIDSVPYAVAD
jgi:hypothetical protein